MEGKGTLHERWLQRTETAYRRMFEGKSQEELVTLTERETMAVLIGRELAAFLLEEHVSLDAAAQPGRLPRHAARSVVSPERRRSGRATSCPRGP